MAEISRPEFVSNLERSQLLRDAQVQLLKKQLLGNPLTTEELANVLVSQKHLTEWQARQLLKGQTGFVLDQYRLLDPIGRGGMGHVFRGLDTRTNSVVAVKVMAKNLTGNETLVSRFRREIRANSQLNNPHVVRSLDAGRVGKVDFMVMEFVNGDQVDRIAQRLGRIPAGLSCEMIRQAADGLQHAHENKMVHRDIKPANIMVHWTDSGEGIVKLMDMGLVLLMADDIEEKTVTRAGQVMGTPDYMSPEQGWDTAAVDIRSDIYSLGCTLFRLLTGTVPFTGTNPLQVLSQRLQRDAPSVRTIRDDIPQDVATIVAKMTARDPEKRYQEPADVVAALEAVSERLTRKSLKAAAQKVTNDPDAHFASSDSNDVDREEGDETDGTYRQFLNEVQAGSAVDLMLATDSANGPTVETVPELNIDLSHTLPRGRERTGTSRRRQTFAYKALGFSAVGLTLVGGAFLMNSAERSDGPSKPLDAELLITPAATATFADAKTSPAVPGEEWTYDLNVEVSGPTGTLDYQLSSTAPLGMSVDTELNRLVWPVPEEQSPGRYSTVVSLSHLIDGKRISLAERTLEIRVKPSLSSLNFPDHRRPFQLAPGKLFTLDASPDSDEAEGLKLQYDVVSDAPGLKIDKTTGQLTWTPALSQFGRYEATISISEVRRPKELRNSELRFVVMPTHIDHVLPKLPNQMAQAGETFRLPLPRPKLDRPVKGLGKRIVMPAPGAPDSLTIDPDSNEVVWKIPDDISGEIRVPLTARLEAVESKRNVDLAGKAVLRIFVSPLKQTMAPKTFSEKNLLAAAAELKKTFAPAIAQARTTAEKALLASRLLEQSYEAKPGAADAALLRIIEEDIATKARATDVLLEIARLRAERYGKDESTAVTEILASFRKTGLSQKQQDLIVERCLQLALPAIAAKDFQLTEILLNTVDGILGRGAQGAAAQLAEDVSAALKIAADLTTSSKTAVSAIKIAELSRLIERWQFEIIFVEQSALAFAQFTPTGTTPPLSNSGRGLWTIDSNGLKLESNTEATVAAVIDGSKQIDRFVLRFEIGPQSNCAQLLFAMVGSTQTDVNGVRLILNASGLGKLAGIRNNAAMNDPTKIVAPKILADQANLVELVVDGPLVMLRINGGVVTQTEIPDLEPGRIGFAADLMLANPKLNIRRPRVLVLPNAE